MRMDTITIEVKKVAYGMQVVLQTKYLHCGTPLKHAARMCPMWCDGDVRTHTPVPFRLCTALHPQR